MSTLKFLGLSMGASAANVAPLIVYFALPSKLGLDLLNNTSPSVFTNETISITGVSHVLKAMAHSSDLYSQSALVKSQIDRWIDYSEQAMSDFKTVTAFLALINSHLTLRSFLVSHQLSLADIAIWGKLKGVPLFQQQIKSGTWSGQPISRWYSHVASLEYVCQAFNVLDKAKDGFKDRKDQGSMDIPLPDAEMNKVVTRFPPEPSGYLHIGHAKAAMLNEYFARKYNGKLILRFDDTNPSKEKAEFEQSIGEDLKTLGVHPDITTHTSDSFKIIHNEVLKLINLGLAYVDDTEQETMQAERFDGIESKNRNMSIAETLLRFEDMKMATEQGLKSCLRAKIDMNDKNKAMRDPVIYRVNLTPHHITKSEYKVYPTYDFACPVVDSYEGVTHALRTVEYRDRNAQYHWFLKALSLRFVHLWDFSRLNFVYTLLSKRKLAWFVDNKVVAGWDDPRFATVRGIIRRGMTVDALRQYILSQGASQREIQLEWDKIWTLNKKVIDPISPRHTALLSKQLVTVKLDHPTVEVKSLPKHKKNDDIGMKNTLFGPDVFLEQADARILHVGDEVTFMDWGNVIIESIDSVGELIVGIKARLFLEGDFKKTKLKLTWLCSEPNHAESAINIKLFDYDYLITKKKLEQDDVLEDFVTKTSEYVVDAIGDANLSKVKKGSIIQLERKGYYICDRDFADGAIHLIKIPDGKVASLASKETAVESTVPSSKMAKKSFASKKDVLNPRASISQMYAMESIYSSSPAQKSLVGMYDMQSIYADFEVPTGKPQTKPIEIAVGSIVKPENKPQETKVKQEIIKPIGKEEVSISRLDIVVGRIISVAKHPDADSLYVEQIDVGESTPRTVVSGLVKFMQPEEMVGKLVLILKNLKPVAMRGIKSYAMVLCASNSEHTEVVFLIPHSDSKAGDKVWVEGYQGIPDEQLNPKKKVWDTLQPQLSTSDEGFACWNQLLFKTPLGPVTCGLKNASIK